MVLLMLMPLLRPAAATATATGSAAVTAGAAGATGSDVRLVMAAGRAVCDQGARQSGVRAHARMFDGPRMQGWTRADDGRLCAPQAAAWRAFAESASEAYGCRFVIEVATISDNYERAFLHKGMAGWTALMALERDAGSCAHWIEAPTVRKPIIPMDLVLDSDSFYDHGSDEIISAVANVRLVSAFVRGRAFAVESVLSVM